jgi:uncharacterized protein (UPF0333 family)
MELKRGQISTEYLIVIAFVMFVVISSMGVALYYSMQIKDDIKFSQIEKVADKITSSAETVFYSGKPSKMTLTNYIPEGVNSIKISNKDLTFNVSTSTGENIVSYSSNVFLYGNISNSPGVKRITLIAEQDRVIISSN